MENEVTIFNQDVDTRPAASQNEEKLKKLEVALVQQRKNWNKQIQSLVQTTVKSINPQVIVDAQADILSYRHQLVELQIQYMIKNKKILRRLKEKYKSTYREYFNYDQSLNQKEKKEFTEADLAQLRYQYDLIETHIYYLEQSINTIDKVGWAIKNKLNTH